VDYQFRQRKVCIIHELLTPNLEKFLSFFQSFGEVDECLLMVDKVTSKLLFV